MSLLIGEKAPNFILPSTTGVKVELYKDYYNKPVIIYFYPKDFTFGCTAEACDFRNSFDYFKNLEIDVLGISKDSIISHLEFKKKHNLPFHLLSDSKLEVSNLYKAVFPIVNFPKRVTYLLNKDHFVVGVYDNMLNAKSHIKQMQEAVKAMK